MREEPVKLTSTGLSKAEKNLIRKTFEGTPFVLEDHMTRNTKYLLVYRSIFTEKRIQADKWGVPCVSVLWVYGSLSEKSIKKYQIRKYEGCLFTSSGIINGIFINYYRVQGAEYTAELTRACDFLVVRTATASSTKLECARENGIPVVKSEDVFVSDIDRMHRKVHYDTHSECLNEEEVFNGISFLVEGDTEIKRLVTRCIIEHGGNRVRISGPDVTYTVYFGGKKKSKATVWYHWILDCVEMCTLLSPDRYLLRGSEVPAVPFEKITVFFLLPENEQKAAWNKVEALGGSVQRRMNSQVTHCIVASAAREKKTEDLLRRYKIKICTMEWVNQCLYHLRLLSEARFGVKKEPQHVFHTVACAQVPPEKTKKTVKLKCKTIGLEEWRVQFTGIFEEMRNEAEQILTQKGAQVLASSEYSNECTHLIVGALSISLKFLAAVASGAVLLDYRVVEHIRKNQDIQEKEYSLEKRNLKVDVGKNERIVRQLIIAAPKWKEHREKTGKKAFSGWSVIVLAEKGRGKIENLVSSGGGEVLSDSAVKKGTVVFTDGEKEIPEHLASCDTVQIKDLLRYLARVIE